MVCKCEFIAVFMPPTIGLIFRLGKNRRVFRFPDLENTCHQADKRLDYTFLQIWLGVTIGKRAAEHENLYGKNG